MRVKSNQLALITILAAAFACVTVSACSEKTALAPTGAAKTDTPSLEAAAKVAADKAREDEAAKIGVEAVVYGLPLIIFDLTKGVYTNTAAPEPNGHAPLNQFGNFAKYPTAANRDVVRLNVDTLYSFAWLDLSKEPMILSVPDTHGRYYLMPMIDARTNVFASPGIRTTGTKAGNFAIVGPGWTGTLPKGVVEYKSPTNAVMIAGRTQANGPADYKVVNALQAQYKVRPLSAWGKAYTPPAGTVNPAVDMAPPAEQVAKMSAETFFKKLAEQLKLNPPPAADAPAVALLAKIGIVPGQDFDIAKLDPAVAKGLQNSVKIALEKLQEAAKASGKPINGWRIPPKDIADFGTDYGTRAVVSLIGLGANVAADAIYPSAYVDGEGKALTGANRYVLHFDKGQTPPANAFWSITMYDPQSYFVDNPINRYNIAGWMPLKYNKDGSLDLYVQRESPGKDKEANWLPAAKDEFSLTMRVYWPKPAMLDGTWKPSALQPAK